MDAEAIAYAVNATLLITHQVDSAYWEEWGLFHIPGGIQLNLRAQRRPHRRHSHWFRAHHRRPAHAADVFAILLATGGVFAFVIHTFFLLRGDHRFRTPVSIAIIAGLLAVSVAQGILILA